MYFLQHLKILIVLLLLSKNQIKCELDWTYDLVALTTENKTPDIIYIDLHITRPAGGIFALSGTIDMKKDLTDEFHMKITVYFSLTRSNFIKSPLNVPESNLTSFMNNFYKNIAMESSLSCSENAVAIKDRFVAPLTKRVIRLNNCTLLYENMPSKLMRSYYKIVFSYMKQAEGSLEVLVKVKPKW